MTHIHLGEGSFPLWALVLWTARGVTPVGEVVYRGDRLMDRWKQYGGLAGPFAAFLAAGYWGITATGSALPWAKRSESAPESDRFPTFV